MKDGVIGEYIKNIHWYHNEALACWADKRLKRKACPIRKKRKEGLCRKCQVCLDKLPIEIFGL